MKINSDSTLVVSKIYRVSAFAHSLATHKTSCGTNAHAFHAIFNFFLFLTFIASGRVGDNWCRYNKKTTSKSQASPGEKILRAFTLNTYYPRKR